MKHVGLFNAQHVTIILHKMPNEDHMCLVVFDDKCPPRYFDKLKEVVKTQEAQDAKNLADILENVTLSDGRNLARLLYTEGHLKKVPCNQVFATPYGYTSQNKIKLSELNDYIDKIEEGGEALKKLDEFEKTKGMNIKKRFDRKLPGEGAFAPAIPHTSSPTLPAVVPESKDVMIAESEKLKFMAAKLLEESDLLMKKAESEVKISPVKKTRGRPTKKAVKE